MLIFVYNADTGLFNAVSDIAHKLFSPQTYACNLCKLTHGNLKMKQAWREFMASLQEEMRFLHRDEFQKEFPRRKDALPAIFRQSGDTIEIIIKASVLNAINDLDTLIAIMQTRLGSA